MSKLGTIVKVGAIALGAVGAVAEVANVVEQHTEQQIVEQYNYENIHEINYFDTYLVNGEEVSAEEFEELKSAYASIATRAVDQDVRILDEVECTIYFGTASKLPTTLSALRKISYENTPSQFSKNLACDDEFAIFAVPSNLVVEAIYIDKFNVIALFETYTIGNYTVYHTADLSADAGYDYTLYLTK